MTAIQNHRQQFFAVLVVATLGLLTMSLSQLGAQTSPMVPQREAVQAKTSYAAGDVHLANSRVYILVDKTGFGHVHGVAGMIKEGHLELDRTTDAGYFVFDMTSFVADASYARKYLGIEGESSASTQRQVTANMLGPDVLNAREFPTATYQIHSLEKTSQVGSQGAPVYQFKGELTLHGTTRPVSFLAEVEIRGDWRRVHGRFPLRQSNFGIKPYTKILGAVGVADDLVITGDLWVAATAVQQ